MTATREPSRIASRLSDASTCDRRFAAARLDEYRAEGVADNEDMDEQQIRAATMLPIQLLGPGEIIILALKPSPAYILLAPLKSLTIMVILTMGALVLDAYLQFGFTQREIIGLGVAAIAVRLFWQFAEWLSRAYVLTDRRVITVQGVLRVSVFECRLQQIQQTHLLFTLRERFFALGTIGFATAGTGTVESYWVMLAQPMEVHQRVVEALQRYGRR